MKLAYCGDRCDVCPRYKENISKDLEELRKIALLWKKVGWPHDLDNPINMICEGNCKNIEICEYGIKECCLIKGVNNCGECEQFPCELVEAAFEIAEKNAQKFKSILNQEEYLAFEEAFFNKKRNLEEIHEKKK